MPNNILLYPFTSPIILDDSVFLAHGGVTGSTSSADRQVAYFLAEQAVSEYLNTFLDRTIVTGTYTLHAVGPVSLGFTYVWNILGVTIWSRDRDSSCSMSSDSSCAYLRNGVYGIVDVNLKGNCNCATPYFDPYQIEIAFDAGLPTGTSRSPTMLRALTRQAQIELNEIGLASINESAGDVGVQEFSNQEYSEKRVDLITTRLGSSAISNHVARMLSGIRKLLYVGL